MNTATFPSKPDVERRLRPGRDVLTKTIVDLAMELDVDPRAQSKRLQDVIDLDALYALVKDPDEPETDIQVSFRIWDITYVVTPTSVAATKLH
ncbi:MULTISPECIES: HalOD1 output domain-containing protein [Haloferax]|uniref:Halobacterial output domain-containing protein n=1 Tax=Haloferax marinum TaxID=2666143 RepID=A0A6A8G970_9EURY|nr:MULTISPECIES: HalOD1 output domain-containing protein [Haloferax]KAB1198664.1 hypothetical protein Hfx1150_14520 [Haloferax sp. CBA1150]MRW97780.1 hypothetical protein [Haloferax marinum]